MTNDQLNAHFKELLKHETDFLENEMQSEKNEHGVYIYKSANGKDSIRLDMLLQHYKEWLIDKKIATIVW